MIFVSQLKIYFYFLSVLNKIERNAKLVFDNLLQSHVIIHRYRYLDHLKLPSVNKNGNISIKNNKTDF